MWWRSSSPIKLILVGWCPAGTAAEGEVFQGLSTALVHCLLVQSMYTSEGCFHLTTGASAQHLYCTSRASTCRAGGNNCTLCSHGFSLPALLTEQQHSSSSCKAALNGGAGKWGQLGTEQGVVSAGSHASMCCPASAMLSRACQSSDAASS